LYILSNSIQSPTDNFNGLPLYLIIISLSSLPVINANSPSPPCFLGDGGGGDDDGDDDDDELFLVFEVDKEVDLCFFDLEEMLS
jgi:hypothetical protein